MRYWILIALLFATGVMLLVFAPERRDLTRIIIQSLGYGCLTGSAGGFAYKLRNLNVTRR
jgi:hypothetical protein